MDSATSLAHALSRYHCGNGFVIRANTVRTGGAGGTCYTSNNELSAAERMSVIVNP